MMDETKIMDCGISRFPGDFAFRPKGRQSTLPIGNVIAICYFSCAVSHRKV